MIQQSNLEWARPYLVIPKLIEQPTWGGNYIVTTKNWGRHIFLKGRKIGQSYELFSGSNLSILNSSENPLFVGELTDRDSVKQSKQVPYSIALAQLIRDCPNAILGKKVAVRTNQKMELLIKFTQALGNSFQLHVKDGSTHSFWKPKPESWYWFEPGTITLGVKPGINWESYEITMTDIQEKIMSLSKQVTGGSLTYRDAQIKIKQLLDHYNPWQYVNHLDVARDQLVDLSRGGTHHSWEEPVAPHNSQGNILYELQVEAMDDISTIRNFDKGAMALDGSTRQLHISDYFAIIDRSLQANDPSFYMREPVHITNTPTYSLDQLMHGQYYSLNKLTFKTEAAIYSEKITGFKHVFIKSGHVKISSGNHTITVSTGHSCFIPAACADYTIQNATTKSEVLISY